MTNVELIHILFEGLLSLAAFIALNQLSIAKKDIQTRSKREAASLSAEQVETYVKTIIPKQDALYHKLKRTKFKQHKVSLLSFEESEIRNTPHWTPYRDSLKIIQDDEELLADIGEIANLLETFALFFVKGVADEQIAFYSLGYTFCNSVEGYYFFFVAVRSGNMKGYDAIIELYKIWTNRLRRQNVQKIKNAIEKIQTPDDTGVFPIGTK